MLVQNNHKTPGGWAPVRGSAKRGGEWGGGLVLHRHVVGMSLTSQGSGENKRASVCVCKTRPSFVRCPGRAGPLPENKVTKQQHADWGRDEHCSKGLKKNTCWVTGQPPPGLPIIHLSGSNEVFLSSGDASLQPLCSSSGYLVLFLPGRREEIRC